MEEDIYRKKYSSFDWRRRLAMRLVYETSAADTNLTSLIQEYEAKLRRGVAPFPQPHYLSSDSEENIQCVLYKLLRFGINELEVSLREIIDPASHTRFVHDFSLSFHLAAATSALCCSCPLTDVEEQNLVDGYAAQLISQGHWEWAVYVSLFVLDSSETSYASWKAKKAKSLVIQNFTGALSRAEECRQFLEDVGVPSAWFEEALALRDATNGDSYGFLNHMVNVSTKEICKTLEQVLIPNMIFMNKEKLDESLKLLEVFAVDKNSLAYAVYTFFQVYQSILTLEGASSTEIEGTMPALLEACDSIEQVFVAYKSGEDRQQGKAIRFVPALVPLSSFLAEALSQLSLFKLQMKALQAGISISSTASQILNLSTPEREEFKENSMSARENICRWLM
jgi:nuclear pore complex protein Nup98-Nup96